MTNIFHKKDPLTDAVKSVMEVNQIHREAEALVNEMFGVVSRKALPHEYQDLWEAEFNEIIAESSCGKKMKMEEKQKLDPVGQEDGDVNNDGKINVSDKYLLNRRAAVTKSIMQREREAMSQMDEADQFGADTTSPSSMGIDAPSYAKNSSTKNKNIPGSSEMRSGAGKIQAGQVNKTKKTDRLDHLEEKAVSKAQHRFFGLVRGIQKGEAKGSPEAEKAAKSMSVKSVRDYAKTKEKGLPEKIDEELLDSIQEEIATNLYAELNYVMEHHGEEAGDEWIANLSEEQLAIMEGLGDWLKSRFGTQSMRKDVERKYGGEKPTLGGSIGGGAARKAEQDRLSMGAREAGTYGKQYTKPTPKPEAPKRGYEGGAPTQRAVPGSVVRPKPPMPTAKAPAPKPTAPTAKAPAPARKAKPAAPKPAFRANFQGGFGQRATQAKDVGRTRPGQDR